ncbi:HNH endonuclease [Deinococcus arcticus]|uniref:HNH endonuclease n=1 Tax=Deinococcus arcticus TaxID=2136176 RepID=A0A2T3W8J6_9DEIO|nr:HNH endonuclease [Deinococcus arcticus]PTA68228.1 HNH endonuclease [Deinococcus arcticus]
MARRRAESAWPPPPRPPGRCALCGREVPQLTEHHLLPRSQGRRQGLKAAELPTAPLCPACHKFLHRTFTNAELARDYADLDALRAHEDVARFVAWIRKQPATRAVRVR